MDAAARYPAAKILIVDDEPNNIRLIEAMLKGRAGYRAIVSTCNPLNAIPLYLEFQPDLLLLDLNMPEMDGFQVMTQLRSLLAEDDYLPILVLTGDTSPQAEQRALECGANDFLAKPFNRTEVLLRIQNLLHTRFLQREIQRQNQSLHAQVIERTQALEDARMEILTRLALAAEYRDDDTGKHTVRVGHLAALIASVMGWPEEDVVRLRRAAPLHDVGKIGIPDTILLKPGRLTDEELTIMRTHTTIGARILGGSQVPLLEVAQEIALSHHERWDGSGYPNGLAGAQIPLVAQITAVADVFDALTHERPYKQAWTEEAAIREIERQSGAQFSPDVVAAFLDVSSRGYDALPPGVLPQIALGSRRRLLDALESTVGVR